MLGRMIAVRVHHYGPPEELQLEEIPVPEPGHGEALIRVHAAGAGPWDVLVRTGRSGVPQRLPLTPGSDIAGVVERVGPDTAGFAPGDAIFGVTNPSFTGGYAQYAPASVDSIAPKPQGLSFVEAASVPVVAVTAWQMLFEHAKVAAGDTVVVLGAAGNVGGYAVQLARWAGARVVAVARAEDAAFVRGLGAERTIDADALGDLVGTADAAIDTVGGELQMRAYPALKRGGTLVSVVTPPSQELAERYGVRTAYFIVNVAAEQLARIARLFDEGVLAADLGVVLGLADAQRAHLMLEGREPHPHGKIVFDVTLLKEKT
jgi:NADPH:quinone reductase-like Zn-dependent oxidoreductase